MKVLHIAVHMGAGAGKAVSGMAVSDRTNEHSIILLDKPEKYDHIHRCEQNGISVRICPDVEEQRREAAKADVVVVSWWHHPLIYQALMNIADIPARLVLWCHVNGLYYPEIDPKFLSCFESCMFTTGQSFENEKWSMEEKKEILEKSVLVYGMGDFHPEEFVPKDDYEIKQEKIRIGYVGSLDYAKIHPGFADWLGTAVEKNKDIRFELAGDVTEALRHDMMKRNLSEYVDFLGFREDVKELLTKWDIFIYLLNPHNFATTENALLEAMAAGLPVVASDGAVERSIIVDRQDGILARDERSFAEELNKLSEDHEMRKSLGEQARRDIIGKYDMSENILRFDTAVGNAARREKKPHDFRRALGEEPFDWFLSGCGAEDAERLRYLSEVDQNSTNYEEIRQRVSSLGNIFKGKAKASVRQYSEYFPNDRRLGSLMSIIQRNQEMSV